MNENVRQLVRTEPIGRIKMLGLLALQKRLVFPGAQCRGQAWTRVTPPNGARLLRLSYGGRAIPALWAAAGRADAPVLLVFYGNDMCLARALPIFQAVRQTGVSVLMPEYIGYGMNPGRASESNCYATADAAYEHLLSRGVEPRRIVVMGVSLGGAVAIDLAARREVGGLVTLITFTSIRELARHLVPNFHWSWMLRHRFESLGKIERVSCPTLIVHSSGDELIPMRMADDLSERCGGKVTRVTIDGAGHRMVEMLETAGEQIVDELGRFVGQVARK